MREEVKYKQLNDLEVQKRIRERDQACIEFTYTNCYGMIAAQIRKYNPGLDVDDIYQEAFMVMLNSVYDGDLSCKISTYLYSVSRNLCLKHLRSVKNEADVEIVDVAQDIEDYNDSGERFSKVLSVLNQMGEKCQAIIRLFYLRSYTMEEMAEELGYTNADNAKNQKYKCMKQLKEKMNG